MPEHSKDLSDDKNIYQPNERWSPGSEKPKDKEESLQRMKGPMDLGRDKGEPLKSEFWANEGYGADSEHARLINMDGLGVEEFDPLQSD